jgi:hypothetical protein
MNRSVSVGVATIIRGYAMRRIFSTAPEREYLRISSSTRKPAGIFKVTQSPRLKRAIYYALFQSCSLMSDEVLGKSNQKAGFGHSYETAYFDGEQFKFIDDILYTVWDFYYDIDKGGGKHRFYPEVYKFRSFDYYSIVQRHDFKSDETHFYAITPAFDDMPNLFREIPGIDLSNFKGFSLTSSYYCLFFRLFCSDNLSYTGSVVFPAKQSEPPLSVETVDGREFLTFKFDFIPTLYQIAKSSQSQSSPG